MGNLGGRRIRSVWISQEKHLPAAAWSKLCSSTKERLVLEDEMRESRDFLAADLDLSKGKVRFSVKFEVHTESNRYIINAHRLSPKCT